jgi:hypothetical protein
MPVSDYFFNANRLIGNTLIIDPAVNTFFWRRRKIRRKEDGNFDDLYGPMTLSTVLLVSLATIFASSVIKLAENQTVKGMILAM